MEYVEDKYLDILVDMGLKAHEAKVYLACLRLGQSTVSKIADEADVQRTFVYDILRDLHEKGVVSSVEIGKKKYYSPSSIEQFKRMQEEKFKKFEGLIPEMKAFEMSVGDRPKVKFFEGAEGIKSVLYDPLNILKRGDEVIAYATGSGFYEDEPEFAEQYIIDRVKKGITSRSIAVDTPETRLFTDRNKEQLRETRLVSPDRFDFSNEINIYANKVSIMSMKGELLAVLIESESVARTQRMIFELAWLGVEKVDKMNLDKS